MKVISKLILEDDLTETTIHDKSRTTVRAIITKDNLVLMLYSKYYNDYTFPGGGVKEDENLIESLKRELKEEIGAESIENIEEYGQISELKYSHNLGSKNTYLQTSYYYKLNVNQFGKPSPLLREEAQGIEAKWISFEEALRHNQVVYQDEKHQQKGLKTALIRENEVLRKLIEEYEDEKIRNSN